MRGRRVIPVANPDIGEEELLNVIEAVKSGWISSKGKFIKEFENKFASYLGAKYAISTSSGTAALHLALLALGIGPGDEVLVPDLTFVSPASMVKVVGAKPVLVDVSPDYWCIDPLKIKKKISKRSKAIIVVHIYGHPAKMDEILEIAETHGLYVIEDCAEALGAEFKGRKIGTFGHISCFSFYANKIITTGEGGMCVTNDSELAEKIEILKNHGMRPQKRYWHEVIGFNYRMTNLQAAIGIAQLNKISRLITRKREIAKIYHEELESLPNIVLHPEMSWAKCVYWLYSILLDSRKTRDRLAIYLKNHYVETRNFFYPLHEMPPFKIEGDFAISKSLSERGINLPSGPKIDDDDIVYICSLIKRFMKK
mgnify:CR=1 FL=1